MNIASPMRNAPSPLVGEGWNAKLIKRLDAGEGGLRAAPQIYSAHPPTIFRRASNPSVRQAGPG
jgi:hypothetical protein